ncbi:hypothetical protein AGMMS50243_11610 [Betaproteobacteria bacterium]|nr:hypothetical protein AGMMS50243_11610 [Betaproteobacteria bacterium]
MSLPALADVVWPALYLETRLFTWWAIGLGLFIEFFFVRWLFVLSASKAALATLVANVVSALLGVVLIPLSGIVWEFVPGLLIYPLFHMGTFNPITWAATFILACLVTTGLEALVYKYGVKFAVRRREFGWLLIANALSVAVAFASVFIAPVRM